MVVPRLNILMSHALETPPAAIQENQTSGVEFLVWFEVLLPSQQLWSYRDGQFT